MGVIDLPWRTALSYTPHGLVPNIMTQSIHFSPLSHDPRCNPVFEEMMMLPRSDGSHQYFWRRFFPTETEYRV